MTDQQLKYCRVCQHKIFDPQSGIYCALTNAKPDFVGSCPTFKPIAEADLNMLDIRVDAENLPMATTGNRFVNMLIDTAVYYFLTMIMGFFLVIFLSLVAPDSLSVFEQEGTPWSFYLIALLVYVSYYTFCESVFGRTLGKIVTGTKVVDFQGKLPSTYTIFLRSLARLVPFESFSFLGDGRGWHDAWTDTYVVKIK